MPKRADAPAVYPSALDIERLILGSVLLNYSRFPSIEAALAPDDFFSEAHRKIYRCMKTMQARGEKIDRLTLPNALGSDLPLVGGFAYLTDLDKGLPDLPNLDSYIGILKEKSALRRLILLSQQASSRALAGDGSSSQIIGDLVSQAQAVDQDSAALDHVPSMADIMDQAGGPLELLKPTARNAIKTGYRALDDVIVGLEPRTLTIIGGRPASGKSALAICMASNIAKHEIPVAFFSLEMPARAVLDRLMCADASVSMPRFRAGRSNLLEQDDLRHALERIYELPLYLDDRGMSGMPDLVSKIDRLVRDKAVKVVFLDYCQILLLGFTRDRRNANDILTEIAESAKATAKRLGIAMVLLSQLNREPEKRGDHKPMLGDLRASGGLEQASDVVILCHREWQYKKDRPELKDKCELIVAKNRQGDTLSAMLGFNGAYGARFENI